MESRVHKNCHRLPYMGRIEPCTRWNFESSTWDPDSISWNPESKTVTDYLIWGISGDIGDD